MLALITRLRLALARLVGGRQALTFTQSCPTCRAAHPTSGRGTLRLVRKV